MILVQVWNDFVMYTAPALSGSVLFVYLQMMVGAVSPLHMILTSAKRDSMAERILLSVTPAIFVVTVAICEPLLFGSFLGEGFVDTSELISVLDQPAFFAEVMVVAGVFAASAVVYLLVNRRRGRLSVFSVLLNVGAETVVVAVALILCTDCWLAGGTLLRSMEGAPVKWFIYGVFLLIYKTCLYLVSLLWYGLFSERQRRWVRGEPHACENQVKAYFSRGYGTMGIGLLMFTVFYVIVVTYNFYKEDGVGPSLYFFGGLGLLPGIMGVYFLMLALFPRLIPCYRKLRESGDWEQTAREICEEMIEEEPLLREGPITVTRHYLFVKGIRRELYYLPKLQEIRRLGADRNLRYRLLFQDGAMCTLDGTGQAGCERTIQLLRRRGCRYTDAAPR